MVGAALKNEINRPGEESVVQHSQKTASEDLLVSEKSGGRSNENQVDVDDTGINPVLEHASTESLKHVPIYETMKVDSNVSLKGWCKGLR